MVKYEPIEKPKHQWLSDIISISSLDGAKEACTKLSYVWDTTDSRDTKRLLIKGASDAIRRSVMQLKRTKNPVSTKERGEFREIIILYQSWLRGHRLV
jgi:hypothetical protein